MHDPDGSVLVLTRENHRPYHRPPLTKDIWTGQLTLERLPVHEDAWYHDRAIELRLRNEVIEFDPDGRRLWDERGVETRFDELLIATGCRPRRLRAEGAELSSVRYFRDLEDYLDLERRLDRIQHVTLVGGGFTALEMAMALRGRRIEVTQLLPEEYPLPRFFSRELGLGLVDYLREHGVEVVTGDALAVIEETPGFVHARTENGSDLTTQLVLVDIGSEPLTDLAEAAGLDIDDGIVVDDHGRTSKPHVWAAGDVAEFPYAALGQLMRVEGTDHAQHMGRLVGANMAGADLAYHHLPRKWFRIGDLTFEGLGELSGRLDHETVWVEPGREGAFFYLREGVVRGVLLLGLGARLDWARDLVQRQAAMTDEVRHALTPARA
jgi:NADPH-dependent 2,4-dienoyl-CoA reductase/sulfur reductase-like enzyme